MSDLPELLETAVAGSLRGHLPRNTRILVTAIPDYLTPMHADASVAVLIDDQKSPVLARTVTYSLDCPSAAEPSFVALWAAAAVLELVDEWKAGAR